MTADILHLPTRELTTPLVEHTITVRSGANAGFYINGKKVSLATAAATVSLMAAAINLADSTADPFRLCSARWSGPTHSRPTPT